MNRTIAVLTYGAAGRWMIAAFLSAAAVLAWPTITHAQSSEDAHVLLKTMSDYLADQTAFSFSYESAVEAVTEDFEKLQFVSSGTVTVNRPNKLRVTRTGGFIDAEIIFDGSTLTVHGRNLNAYAQIEGGGTLDDLGERLAGAGAEPPAADLLASDSFETLIDGVVEAKHIGTANVHGVPCEYLAFRKPDFDFQIWIAIGDKPVPVRYAITSKHAAQAPQYVVEISDWRIGDAVASLDFSFTPGDARKVDLSEIEMLDELPSPVEEDEQ